MSVLTQLEPVDAEMTAAMLARAAADRRVVVLRGSGTKLTWTGAAPADHVVLSTRGLSSPIQHYAGDLVATLPAGATLAEVNRVLRGAGQWLPLDPAHGDRATIGGIVATNDSGPRRYRYGAPRDLIIGVEIALSDGTIARAGGRVVKNVAGYDLSRLYCGSFGTLGVITSATFKLTPVTPASTTVVARVSDTTHAADLALAIAARPGTPSAIEIACPDPRVLVRFETTERAADSMARDVETIVTSHGGQIERLHGDAEETVWRQHHDMFWNATGAVAKISVLPTDVGQALNLLASRAPTLRAIGRGALGVLYVRVDEREAAGAFRELESAIAPRSGTVTLLDASDALRAELPRPARTPLDAVTQALKARFDPTMTLR